MSFSANKQRCGFPFTSIFFILQLGCMWASFTTRPNDPSSLEASILKKMETWEHITIYHNKIRASVYISQHEVLPIHFSSPFEREHKRSTWRMVKFSSSLGFRIIYHIAPILNNKISFANWTLCKYTTSWKNFNVDQMIVCVIIY